MFDNEKNNSIKPIFLEIFFKVLIFRFHKIVVYYLKAFGFLFSELFAI